MLFFLCFAIHIFYFFFTRNNKKKYGKPNKQQINTTTIGLVIGLDKLEDITEEAMDTMLDTNVKGLVYVTQAVVPGMRTRNSGHIINIGSVAGQQAYANGSIYCASKAAVASITRALMAETIDTAIRVSEINPGK